ncbi:MAG: hypothetical protein QXZ17_11990 [Nitrososphaerota archaeon]
MTDRVEIRKEPKDCKFYNSCSASLCPLDPGVNGKVWLPGETDEICRNKEFAGLQFIKTQKKGSPNSQEKKRGER